MDPIPALSLAAAIVQFLDFGLQALALCREIRDDATGATETNKRLEQHAKHIQSLHQQIGKGSSGISQGSRRINKIASDCTATTNEILQLLDKVRLATSTSAATTAKATFRVLKERRTIEKLQNILKERQALLDSALVDVRHRLDLATLTQSEQFVQLQDGVKNIVTRLEYQSTSPTRQCTTHFVRTAKSSTPLPRPAGAGHVYQHVTIGGVGNKIHLGNHYGTGGLSNEAQAAMASSQQFANRTQELENSLQNSHKTTHQQLALVRSDLSQQRIESKLADSRNLLLNSLFFREQAARQSSINPPHQKTFDWVLDESRERAWSSFPEWLRGSSSLYWISGKPGSGKSTLMAHIVNNPSIRSLLQDWMTSICTADSLYVLNFFFWRSGSPLQRSIEGLLRSLLFQLIERLPEVAPYILAKHALEHGRIPQWTERMVTDAVYKALKNATKEHSCCIFIDGLDEFVGDTNTLLEFVLTISTIPSLKICVSSRREIRFVNKLSAFPQLRMEQLNYNDIREVVTSQLQTYQNTSNLAWQIYSRADGVFLWAVLVTRSTLQGIDAGDDDKTLKMRVEMVPREVADLIKQIFATLDAVYTESISTFLSFMRPYQIGLERPPNLALFTAAQMDSDIFTYEDFLEQCMRMKKQIVAQSCGLLQVADAPTCEIVTAWASVSELRRAQIVTQAKAAQRPRTLDRIHGPVDATIDALIRCELTDVSWMHRSVHDMVYGADADNSLFASSVMTMAEATKLLIDGKMRLLAAAPSIDQYSTFSLSSRVADMVVFTRKCQRWISNSVFGILDDLIDSASMFSREEFETYDEHWTAITGVEFDLLSPAEVAITTLARAFVYSKCVEVGLIEYSRRCIANIDQINDSVWILSRMLYQCCARYVDYHNLKDLPEYDNEADFDVVTAEERKYLLHDLLETLTTQLSKRGITEQAAHTVCTGFWRADGKYWVNVSWDRKVELSQRDIERETVCSLAISYYRWTASGFNPSTYNCWRGQQSPSEHPEAMEISVLQQWHKLLAHWNVYVGLSGRKAKYISRDTLYYEGSPNARPPATLSCRPCEQSKSTCSYLPATGKPSYRILCKLKRSPLRFDSADTSTLASLGTMVRFDLSPALNRFFAFLSSLSLPKDEDFKEEKWFEESGFFDAMIKDVWDDENRQLNAWQQLFVLACIRKERRENLRRIEYM